MKKINKFLSTLLATILILSIIPVSVANASDEVVTFSVHTDVTGAKAGDTVNVSVNMTETLKVSAMTLELIYDDAALEVVSGSSQNKYGYEEFSIVETENQILYIAASMNENAVSGTLFNVQFKVLKTGCTEVAISVDELADISFKPIPNTTHSAKIHNYNDVVKNPTCTEEGYTVHTCNDCGKSCTDSFTKALGHSYVNWITVIEPKCESEGLEKSYCVRECGEFEENILPALNHKWDDGVLTRPTSTEKGYYTFTCQNDSTHTRKDYVESADYTEFSKVYSTIVGYLNNPNITPEAKGEINAAVQKAAANNPDFFSAGQPRTDLIKSEQSIVDKATADANEIIAVVDGILSSCQSGNHDVRNFASETVATCTQAGTKKGTCYYCGIEIVEDDEDSPALGHDIKIDEAKEPDCENTGLSEGSHCSRCDDMTVEQEIIPALGHKYKEEIIKIPTHTENGEKTFTCGVCKETYTEIIEADGTHKHIPKVTKEATCTENGVMTYTCACNDEYTEIIPMLGHKYDSEVTEPTCTEGGYTTYTCSVCNNTYTDDEVPETGHSYDSVVTAPTCTEDGFTTYTCSACNDVYTDNVVSATGHSYDSEVTAPTCTETGYTTYTCTVCVDTYVDDETPANGHSFSNGNCTVCGSEDPDYYVFSLKEPSIKTIRNKDGIILHTEVEGNAPEGSYVEWTSDNGNFDKTVMNNGKSLQVVAKNKGNTTFTATLYDVNGNKLASDSVTIYSDSGLFQKIAGFFRMLFDRITIYEN